MGKATGSPQALSHPRLQGKPAVASQYVLVERPKPAPLALVFVAVLSGAAMFLVGDWTAESRFSEREDSLRAFVAGARADVKRLRDSFRAGCFAYVDPAKPRSSAIARNGGALL